MPSNLITQTVKSDPNFVWWELTTEFFTTSQIETIIYPFLNFRNNLPGFQSFSISDINDNTRLLIWQFDTLENANNALNQYIEPNKNVVFRNKDILFKDKMKDFPNCNIQTSIYITNT